MRFVVTGADGFLGWHFRCLLKSRGFEHVVPVGRAEIGDPVALAQALQGADVVYHFAGMNRGTDAEVEAANPDLVRRLCAALDRADSRATVVFASSSHIHRDTAYGRSKLMGAAILGEWGARAGARTVDVVIPNVFGERGRPFYNSVVSTFCALSAQGKPLTLLDDVSMDMMHAQDVCDRLLALADEATQGRVELSGRRISVSEIKQCIESHAAGYGVDGILPDVRDPFELALFNTWRSYRFPEAYPAVLKVNADQRGWLFEAVKARQHGQTFVSHTKPGIVRGNHWHRRKIERFAVLHGQARIGIRRLFDAEVHDFDVTGDAPVVLDMPTLHTHNIINTGDGDLITMFWANEFFDPAAPDTYPEKV